MVVGVTDKQTVTSAAGKSREKIAENTRDAKTSLESILESHVLPDLASLNTVFVLELGLICF